VERTWKFPPLAGNIPRRLSQTELHAIADLIVVQAEQSLACPLDQPTNPPAPAALPLNNPKVLRGTGLATIRVERV
jgi:hypothetical protein